MAVLFQSGGGRGRTLSIPFMLSETQKVVPFFQRNLKYSGEITGVDTNSGSHLHGRNKSSIYLSWAFTKIVFQLSENYFEELLLT